MKLLVVYSSLNGDNSMSTRLAKSYVSKRQELDNADVTELDLAASSLGHLTGEEMQAWMTPVEKRTSDQVTSAAISDSLVEQLQRADELVLAVPMYNFGVPSVLKAYFDRLARAGVTFKYTETGPVGLLEGKSATVITTRGGIHLGQPTDTQTDFIKTFLGFIGINQVNFVYAEGLNMGEDAATNALSSANEKIIELTS